MSTTIGKPAAQVKDAPKPNGKAERIVKAFKRKVAKTKRTAQSVEQALSEKYEAVKDKIEGNKSGHDYNRRTERFRELIAECKGDRLLSGAVAEAERALKGFPLAKPDGKADWSDEHMKVGLAAAKLTQAREAAESQAADARTANPGVASIVGQARDLLAERRIPDDERLAFEKRVDDLAFAMVGTPGNAKDLLATARALQDAIVKAANTALNTADLKMKRHGELSRQLAGSKAEEGERLAISTVLQAAEDAIRIYDYATGDAQLDEAARRLGKPGKLPSADDLQAPLKELGKKLTALANAVGSSGAFESRVYKEVVGLNEQLESLDYMLAKGGDVAAVDAARILEGCQKGYERLAKAEAEHAAFVKNAPVLQQVFDGQCKRVAAAAAAYYAKQGAPKGTTGVYDTRIDALRTRWAADYKAALCEDDLNIDAAVAELEAMEAEMKKPGSKMTPEQITFDGIANRFIVAIRQLDEASATLMANNSAEAFKLGLLTEPAKLRLAGEQVTKSPPPPAELAARGRALQAVTDRITAKLAEIAKVKIDPSTSPDALRRECATLQAALTKRIDDVLAVIAKTNWSTEVDADARKALVGYSAALKRDLALVAAPAEPGASADTTILKEALSDLRSFAPRVASFEAMGPGDKHVKGTATFKQVDKLVASVDSKLGLPVFAPRNELTAPWRTVIDAYKAAPTRKDPAIAVPELTILKETVRAAVKAAKEEHSAADTMKTQIEDMMSEVTLAKGSLKAAIEASPKCFLALMRDFQAGIDSIAQADKPDPSLFRTLQERRRVLFDTSPAGTKPRQDAEARATEAEGVYDAAKFNLQEVLAVDIPLLMESAKAMSGEAKKEMTAQLNDMRKAANGALATLKQNRDAEAAKAMCDSIKSRLKTIEASPLGNTTRNRNELTKVRQRWTDMVGTLHREIEAVPGLVEAECEGDVAAAAAARSLRIALVDPVKALFRAEAFDSTLKRMAVADEAGLADAREDALREIRRMRRVLASDPLVRQLAKTPFGTVKVPFGIVEMALWDLETNLLTSDT